MRLFAAALVLAWASTCWAQEAAPTDPPAPATPTQVEAPAEPEETPAPEEGPAASDAAAPAGTSTPSETRPRAETASPAEAPRAGTQPAAQTPTAPAAPTSQEPPEAAEPAAACAAAAPTEAGRPASPVEPTLERFLNIAVLADEAPFSALGRFGVRTGFDVDVARAICERIGAACELVPMEADAVAQALIDRRVDAAVVSRAPTKAFDEIIDFTDPYVKYEVRYIVPREQSGDLEAESAVIGALSGSIQAEYLRDTVGGSREVRLYSRPDELYIDLAMGRLTAVLDTAIPARRDFLSTPIGEPFRFASGAVQDEGRFGGGAAIMVREGDDALTRAVNAALAAYLESSDYADVLSRHFGSGLASRPNIAPARN